MLIDQFGDVDKEELKKLFLSSHKYWTKIQNFLKVEMKNLQTAIKMAIEDANLAGSVIIDNSQTDNSTDIKPTQPSPGNPGPQTSTVP